ncbi:WD40 repeat protein [Capnocytophaga leadbetteri]|uniref:WD40 repeat protein n=1 Tax=Capnocytophaga leadbetteri TaxID=327575 RepID=A0A2T5XWX3_9FLAO|nr:OmpA family protein [Capnocytophaga leadbetteri]PTX07962.1 WD40 repeat protein [Capnocytophaga leadbetteri]
MKLLNITLAFLCTTSLFAQHERELQKANNMYKNYAYVDAIKIYEKIAEKGYVNQEMLESLGNSYYYNAEYKNALRWYEQLFEEGKYDVKTEYYYRYAQALKSVGRYDESDKMMNKFAELTGNTDTRAVLFEENKDYQEVIHSNSGRLELHSVSINTEFSEYGTALYGDKIVFTAANSGKTSKGGVSQWTGESYYDLYIADRDKQALSNKKFFSTTINTPFNESTAVFTKDGNTLYFTRNNYVNRRIGTNVENTILLKILRATKDSDGHWGNVVELPFNSNNYNVAHPALSPDEKFLYFASDMEGTLGESDIFRVEILGDNEYSTPENLGDVINTSGRESFPFVSKNNILYYSSDGIPGLGGLDIFAVKFYENGTVSKPINIGMPGNSADDDFCFVMDSDTKVGFLSSNRPGGKGRDDIYSFYEEKPLVFDCEKMIKGVLKDSEKNDVIADGVIVLSDKTMKEVARQKTKEDGSFAFDKVDCKDLYYYLRAEIGDYVTTEVKVDLNVEGDVFYEFMIKPREIAIDKDVDLAKVLNIKEIYFDFDKSDIRPDAAVELAKIVEVMRENPKMKIDIRSHTDSRGDDSYNLRLSDRRAKATLEWMVKQGIERKRLTAKGYGETQLVNGCSNGVPCTDEEHQANRRSEFIIVSMD